ncbi:hypothetical protein BKA63DRAFT_556486 [Paraphoma chrysanthemicola]|nr:hypothetical protein BKA63DRAFT_556486 [Paraphoma chrysanthemicola]
MVGYDVYKPATDVFLSWLCITAADNGAEVESSRPIDPVYARAGKRRGNAKSRKRDKAKPEAAFVANAANNTSDGRPIYLVSSEEILRLAKYLSRLATTVVMPRTVWQAYKQALAGRREYAERYARDTLDDGDVEEEDGHVAFIGLLETTAEYIKGIAQVQQVASAKAGEIEATVVLFSNMFDSLMLLPEEEVTHTATMTLQPLLEDEFKPKMVFRLKVDGKAELRLQRQGLLEQADQERTYVAGLMKSPLRDIVMVRQIHPGYTFPLALLSQRHVHASKKAVEADLFLAQYIMDLGLETSLLRTVWEQKDMIAEHTLEEPLLPSSRDMICQVLQKINEGEGATLQAASAASILQHLATQVYAQDSEPLQLLLNINMELDSKVEAVGKANTVILNENRKLSEQLRTLRGWVGTFPFVKLHAENEDERRQTYTSSQITAGNNPLVLRQLNSTTCGSMQLGLLALYSELGMATANFSPHIFAMCYLYQSLKINDRLCGPWSAIEVVTKRHCKDFFVGEEIPTENEKLHTHIKLAVGRSLAHIMEGRRAGSTGRRVSVTSHIRKNERNWEAKPSELVQLLRDYIHGRKSLLQILYPMEDIIRRSTGAWQSYIENGTISFLHALEPALKGVQEEIQFDYLTLDTVCRSLFRRIDGRLRTRLPPMKHVESWEKQTTQSYDIVLAILNELVELEGIRKRNPNMIAQSGHAIY